MESQMAPCKASFLEVGELAAYKPYYSGCKTVQKDAYSNLYKVSDLYKCLPDETPVQFLKLISRCIKSVRIIYFDHAGTFTNTPVNESMHTALSNGLVNMSMVIYTNSESHLPYLTKAFPMDMMKPVFAVGEATLTHPVDSPAFVFAPFTWQMWVFIAALLGAACLVDTFLKTLRDFNYVGLLVMMCGAMYCSNLEAIMLLPPGSKLPFSHLNQLVDKIVNGEFELLAAYPGGYASVVIEKEGQYMPAMHKLSVFLKIRKTVAAPALQEMWNMVHTVPGTTVLQPKTTIFYEAGSRSYYNKYGHQLFTTMELFDADLMPTYLSLAFSKNGPKWLIEEASRASEVLSALAKTDLEKLERQRLIRRRAMETRTPFLTIKHLRIVFLYYCGILYGLGFLLFVFEVFTKCYKPSNQVITV